MLLCIARYLFITFLLYRIHKARVEWGHISGKRVRFLDGSSNAKEFAYNAGDPDSIPGPGRSPGEGHGNPLQYSCLENPTDRRTWWATVHVVAKSPTQLKRLHTHSLPEYRTRYRKKESDLKEI